MESGHQLSLRPNGESIIGKEKIERNQKQKSRNSNWRLATVAVIAIVLFLVVYIALFQTNDSGNSQQSERTIGDFSRVSNSPLTDDGKVVVLSIGAEACPYCAAESWPPFEVYLILKSSFNKYSWFLTKNIPSEFNIVYH